MAKKKDFRLAVQAQLSPMLNAVFEHGMAIQRMRDAAADTEFARGEAHAAITAFTDIFNGPEKTEIN